MKYVLDTDHVSILQRQTGAEFLLLCSRMAQHASADFGISIITFHEQVLGCHTFINRARTTGDVVRGYQMMDRVIQVLGIAAILPFDSAAGVVFDGLHSQGVRIAVMDLRIASIALSRGLILLTRNSRDFGRAPGLMTENWTV
jgi:tRNA(fMet)-specific endonuclease VapC